jgi:FAD/FMN-containing dehydrogenase
MITTPAEFESKKERLIAAMQSGDGVVRLDKDTSNLFRDRKSVPVRKLNVRDFKNVIRVDTEAGLVEVEGMTPYMDLTEECLRHNVMPTVVPQLKSITIGGAITGLGIESSSFKYGLVHETVEEMEVLLGDGSTVICTRENEHRDLFYSLPNSYGTLGYVLKLKAKVVPVKPFVRLTHLKFSDEQAFFGEIGRRCDSDINFIDGTIFGRGEYYLTVGEFVDEAPYTSDYSYKKIYYQSIREREQDYLTVKDYLWRWDTDWFWCSKNLHAQNPIVRRILGKSRLNSVSYTKIMRWNSKWGLMSAVNRLLGLHAEAVIQDVELPLGRCAEFLDFYLNTIRFMPVWVCPTRAYDRNVRWHLYRMDPNALYVNFGFWDVIKTRKKLPAGYHNRLIERKVRELSGMKSLYSDTYFSADEFWNIYNKPVYDKLKTKYDPSSRFKDLYTKCVLRE